MDTEPKDLIVLGAIKHGTKKFDKIQKITQIESEELNSILKKLEERGFIEVKEKKGLFGTKIELIATDKGSKEVDERVHELQERWNQMSLIYKSGDKEKLKQQMDDNKSFLPTMMFFGIMDMMMFSMMFSMMGMAMSEYVPVDSMPDTGDANIDDSGIGDSGIGDGGFDIDIGF
ncbi:MAG: winged helix-turn-helix transcriptional regulator [Nitrosopumilus sp.]|nr:winged helix-turn-helix transcriptional regulator [Nitrosopumilus sp.]MDH5658987.1 winged helix-turn-helix transcriptional regulator [Nitrosopumilus sp.]